MRRYDMTQPLTDEESAALGHGLEAMGKAAAPWRWFEREIAIAERTLDAIKGAAAGKDPNIFNPHDGVGWYSRQILTRARWIRGAKKSGNWELVARFSFELGQLASTVRLKNAWDDDVETGVRHRAARETANAANRRATHQDRKTIVTQILAERGNGVRDACLIASARFPALGSKDTFRGSYYKKLSTAEG